jgi:DNA primase
MDNDEAGVSAIERLCGGALLEKIAETSVVEIKAASLPTGIKDPADFIETIRMGTKSGIDTRFRKDVVNESIDWADWYLKLLLSRYDPKALRGSSGSFGDICDRISEFLSTFPNPADRIQRAHDVAGSLAKTIANNSEDGKVSSALRIQLESDLVNMVARKVNVKQSVERRIESVDGVSPQQTSGTLARMVKGDISSTPETDESKLSSRALRSRAHDTPAKSATKREGRNKATSRRGPRPRIRRSSTARKSLDPSLTPHFSGFEFANKSDADWLGLPREKVSRCKH